ncbi:MAG: permease [Eubacteriales bacterium]|nr:permease [Eubacteriales bacterium]MDD3537405.1 permease [Eubacteriales bacterium]
MKTIKNFTAPILVLFVFLGLAVWMPDTAVRSSLVTWDYFKEMALILPPVFILMGLMEVWIPKSKIQSWLGRGSGIKGAMIAVALGTLPTGPLYVAFPMTAALIRKGASFTNMVVFLGSWAALKIPQLMVEIKFMGTAFAVTRFILTLMALMLIGLLMENILRRYPDKEWVANAKK